jgi:hypothetical protein
MDDLYGNLSDNGKNASSRTAKLKKPRTSAVAQAEVRGINLRRRNAP